MSNSAISVANMINANLKGGTIRQAVFSPAADFSEAFPGLIIDMPDGTVKTVWILSDPEGNDAGFLDIESSELL